VRLALRKRQPDQALDLAREAQRLRPGDTLGWMLEGEIESGRNRWPQAVAAYRKALDKPNPAVAARRLYAALVRAEQVAEAAGFAAQWQKSHPQDAEFVFFMGDLAQSRGQLAQAGQLFEQALALAPGHALALNNLAMLRIQSKQPGALDLAQRAARAAPYEPAVLDTLAQALAAQDRLDDALQAQTRAVQLAPDAPEFRLMLAQLLIQSGEKAKAKTELDRLSALGASFKQQDEVVRLLKSIGRG
jgi:Flp pilus assembly protein TadD